MIPLIFFAVPTICLTFRAFTDPDQPFFIRRFVTASFPLLFLLGLSGWNRFLRETLRNQRLAAVILLGLVLSGGLFFFYKTMDLMARPLFSNLIPQVRSLSAKIPSNALVVIPQQDAGIYMELPLQYMIGLDTISYSPDPDHPGAGTAYLERQLKKRPVMIFSLRSTNSASVFQDHFALDFQYGGSLYFSIVPPSLKFPDQIASANLEYSIFKLEKKSPEHRKSLILFSDPDVGFVQFHSMEKEFRWAKQSSEISGFVYSTDGRPAFVVLTLAFLPSDEILKSANLFVNRKQLQFHHQAENELWFGPYMDGNSIRRVELQSKTFIPRDIGLNEDPRELGLPFVSLRFVH
jgi:hypothetical protein